MKTIYKYEIPIQDHFTLELPRNAEILVVQTQFSKPQLWALVDLEAPIKKREFRVSGTGHDLTEDYHKIKEYIGTFQIENGGLVFHLFELKGK